MKLRLERTGLILGVVLFAPPASAQEFRTLLGDGNNVDNPDWGVAFDFFDPGPAVQPFLPLDYSGVAASGFAYTDGVSEARTSGKGMFGTEGVETALSANWVEQSKRWPIQILEEVENRRAGAASDDILIVEIYRA